MPTITAGAVVGDLLRSHRYVAPGIDTGQFDELGEEKNIAAHLEDAKAVWNPELVPRLTGRHLVLAFALDPVLGFKLVESGAVASLLSDWTPGRGSADEPYRLVWDILTDAARLRCDEQPLLAAAVGAPAEWTVELPNEVTELAWSPSGERLAALAGTMVFELAPGQRPHQLGDVPGTVTSLGWDGDGVVALRIESGNAELFRVTTGAVLGSESSIGGGRLSGDGSRAWLSTSAGVVSWSPTEPDPAGIGPATEVLAVGPSGRLGLVRYASDELIVSDQPSTLPQGTRGQDVPDWPVSGNQLAGWKASETGGPRALLVYGSLLAEIATALPGGGVEISSAPWPVKARLATGEGQVTALAGDRAGNQLAVAVGGRVGSWTTAAQRPTARNIPGYESDRATGPDLLGADRDAQALASLMASRGLRPPLTIGLFGPWGSGKSFLLNRIGTMLNEFSKPGAPDGYLDQVRIVRFNAWQYAEANLWASLVDHVLRETGRHPERRIRRRSRTPRHGGPPRRSSTKRRTRRSKRPKASCRRLRRPFSIGGDVPGSWWPGCWRSRPSASR
ncbi:P-loop NTPase fold protein (plasmid) [Kribbella sp. CWNU-51]